MALPHLVFLSFLPAEVSYEKELLTEDFFLVSMIGNTLQRNVTVKNITVETIAEMAQAVTLSLAENKDASFIDVLADFSLAKDKDQRMMCRAMIEEVTQTKNARLLGLYADEKIARGYKKSKTLELLALR